MVKSHLFIKIKKNWKTEKQRNPIKGKQIDKDIYSVDQLRKTNRTTISKKSINKFKDNNTKRNNKLKKIYLFI